jgi:predicted enzyme related to lactoylglutathione lyase
MHVSGKIDYCELSGTDLPAMKHFYETAFGWQFTDYGPTYTAFSESGLEGGIQSDPAESGKPPLIILYADNLEAMLAAVQEAGGEIVRDVFSFPGGRRFHFRDPSGNELAVWSET